MVPWSARRPQRDPPNIEDSERKQQLSQQVNSSTLNSRQQCLTDILKFKVRMHKLPPSIPPSHTAPHPTPSPPHTHARTYVRTRARKQARTQVSTHAHKHARTKIRKSDVRPVSLSLFLTPLSFVSEANGYSKNTQLFLMVA